MKLLIIEDESDLAAAIQRGFVKKGYAADVAMDGAEGLEIYKINDYDLIVLDLNLPTMDGLEVLKAIRERDKLQKIIILSARSAIKDKVLGLDAGANDYLAKPFDFEELDARVRNLLRAEFVVHDTVVSFGPLKLNTKLKTLTVMEKQVELAPKEYSILEYLLLHSDSVVSAEEIIEHIWDSDANLFTDSVKVHISNLRRKLRAAGGEDMIISSRGQGYRIK